MGKTIRRIEILTRIEGIKKYAETHGASAETIQYLERCQKAVMQCEASDRHFIDRHASNQMKVQ